MWLGKGKRGDMMAQFKMYIEWCNKKGLKPNRANNLSEFLSLNKK